MLKFEININIHLNILFSLIYNNLYKLYISLNKI